jgi:hypothetical protein
VALRQDQIVCLPVRIASIRDTCDDHEMATLIEIEQDSPVTDTESVALAAREFPNITEIVLCIPAYRSEYPLSEASISPHDLAEFSLSATFPSDSSAHKPNSRITSSCGINSP